jgi:hypothetical protein
MNRRILILSLLAVMLPVPVSSQIRIVPQEKIMSVTHPRHSQDSAMLSFDTRHIVAERMNEDDVPRSFIYRFMNVGEDTLKIQRLLSTCSCASAVCTRNIVPPGETAEVRVTYNPKGHPGRFERRIFVYTVDDTAPAAVLKLSVDVQKGKDLSMEWPVQKGNIRLRRSEVRFQADTKAVESLRFVNLSGRPLRLECEKAFLPEYLSFDVVPEVVGPDCEGVMRISYSPSSREPRKDVRLILKGLGVPPSQSVINIKIE